MKARNRWISRVLRIPHNPRKRHSIEFPQFIDASPDPIVITKPNGAIFYVNKAWENFTGYSFVEVKGQNPRILKSGKTPQDIYKKIWISLKSGNSYSTDRMILRRKSGDERQVHTLYFPIMKGGRPLYFVQTYHDISPVVKVQKKLQLKEALLKEMIDNADGVAVYVMNRKGYIITWNKGTEQLYGYKGKDVLGHDCSIFYPQFERKRKRQQALLQQAIEEGKAQYEGWHVRKDGSYLWIQSTITAIKNKQGRIVRFIKIARDMTEQKRMEAIVREDERRTQEMFENISLVVVRVNKEGIVTYVNPYYFHVTGFKEDDIIGRSYLNLVPQSQRKRLKKLFSSLEHEVSIHDEGILLTKSGEERNIHWTNVIQHDALGKPVGILGIGEDITERKRLDEQKNTFFSVASHELKTPITTLKLIAESAIRRLNKLHTKIKELELMDREFDRLTELIDELLDISRVDTGKLSLQLTTVSLPEVIEETVAKLQLLAENREIRFTRSKELLAVADKRRIEQVLTNLITNALKYSDEKTTIDIQARQKGREVIISVTDRGKGIPKIKIEHIFERFYQISSPTERREGFGLGLYICREIIKRHKGRLWAVSEEGKGSTFSFTLPLYREK